jgi:hypothetical protein
MKRNKSKAVRPKVVRAVTDYDATDTTGMIDRSKPLKYEDIGLRLPQAPPTQVISIRLPSALLNNLRAISSQTDIPYQALIKLFLSDSVARYEKKTLVRFSRQIS